MILNRPEEAGAYFLFFVNGNESSNSFQNTEGSRLEVSWVFLLDNNDFEARSPRDALESWQVGKV